MMNRPHKNTHRPLQAAACALALGLVQALAAAQSDQQPAEQPKARAATPATTTPSRIELRTGAAETPQLTREGAFLADMHGELRQTELGWVIDFAPNKKTGDRLNSMVLHQGMTLSAMQQIIHAHDNPIRFVVSGQVFVYHNRNYLLPTRFAIDSAAPKPDTADSEAPRTAPAPDDSGFFDDPNAEPDVNDLLNDVQTAPAPTVDVPIAPASASAASLREGQMIAQVRGRVVLDPSGTMLFTPDTDADKASDEVPPMRLMPCLNVERLEQLRAEWGEQLVVSMSGRVFVNGAYPLLLPTMYTLELERSGNLSLGQ